MSESINAPRPHTNPATWPRVPPPEGPQDVTGANLDGRPVSLTTGPGIPVAPMARGRPSLADSEVEPAPPPPALRQVARLATLPDRAGMIARCGHRPRHDILWGLIAKRSTNYKAVLGHLDEVQAAFHGAAA